MSSTLTAAASKSGEESAHSSRRSSMDGEVTKPKESAKQQTFLQALNLNLHDPEQKIVHHTELFDPNSAIYRRGLPIHITIRLAQQYDPQHHKLSLLVATGPKPIISKGTLVKLDVDSKEAVVVNGWSLVRVPEADSEGPENSYDMKLVLIAPVNTRIGVYKVAIKTQVDEHAPLIFQCKDELYLLFNPWNQEDATYMEAKEDIDEYLLNTHGVIFIGTETRIIGRNWHYGQFEKGVCETALWLIEKAGLPTDYLDDPVLVSRALAAMINGADRGAIESFKPLGNGLSPNQWPGTVSILQKLLRQKGAAVRYGTDWTFSALFCSLNRALGIPCRVVTCYNAAIDAGQDGQVNVHWSVKHCPVSDLNVDSIRTFHTWNEIWFKRTDLGDGMDGWQAVDCTPYTSAESLYRLGPAPVASISSGKLSEIYDSRVFATMTNGYEVHWQVGENGDMQPISLETNTIGSKIVTKSRGSTSSESITETYKLKGRTESSKTEEIIAFLKNKKVAQDIEMSIITPDDVQKGDTIIFTVQMENKASADRNIGLYSTFLYETYNTSARQLCKHNQDSVELKAGEKRLFNIKLRSEEYLGKLTSELFIKAYIQAVVVENEQTLTKTCDVVFEAYKVISFSTAEIETCVGKPFDLLINVENPFRRPLQNCHLFIEGPSTSKIINLKRPLKPQERALYRYIGELRQPGSYQYYVTLISSDVVAREAILTVNVCDCTTLKEDEHQS